MSSSLGRSEVDRSELGSLIAVLMVGAGFLAGCIAAGAILPNTYFRDYSDPYERATAVVRRIHFTLQVVFTVMMFEVPVVLLTGLLRLAEWFFGARP
jgi:hypothetical protein